MYTQNMLYKCIDCGKEEVVLAKNIKDGRWCDSCGGYSSPEKFIGMDLGTGSDKVAMVKRKDDGLNPQVCIIDEMHDFKK